MTISDFPIIGIFLNSTSVFVLLNVTLVYCLDICILGLTLSAFSSQLSTAQFHHFLPDSFYSDVSQLLMTQFPFSIKYTRGPGRCSLGIMGVSRGCEEAEKVEDCIVLYPQAPEVSDLWTWGTGTPAAACLQQAWLL